MHDVPSEPHIDLEARARDEEGKRLIALSDTVDIDELADTVRIERTPRAQSPEREMLQQHMLLD
ncbi:MAG TPA: hypothetical protein VHX68_06445 [Planctomycetaceae bacterium]|jgi:hypothetical protein|nr:hypothetical protein [Planctomycetaceae bacterium]